MITGVAIKVDEKLYFASKPYRHNDIFQMIKRDGHEGYVGGANSSQGFITDKGEFLDRWNALKHAREYGQIPFKTDTRLYSEDLW